MRGKIVGWITDHRIVASLVFLVGALIAGMTWGKLRSSPHSNPQTKYDLAQLETRINSEPIENVFRLSHSLLLEIIGNGDTAMAYKFGTSMIGAMPGSLGLYTDYWDEPASRRWRIADTLRACLRNVIEPTIAMAKIVILIAPDYKDSSGYEEVLRTFEDLKEQYEDVVFRYDADYDSIPKARHLTGKYGRVMGLQLFNGETWIGMTPDMLIESQGKPDNVNRTVTASGTEEQWIYNEMVMPPHDPLISNEFYRYAKKVWSGRSRYFYFEGGVLTMWQDYK